MSKLKPIRYDLFPSLVYHTPFLNKSECERYVKCLEDVEKFDGGCSRSFYQTIDKLHLLNDTWRELSDRVIEMINHVADDQCIIRDSFYNTNMWANISEELGYYHSKHSHHNSFFSSIIYLRGDQSSPTQFDDPRSQTTVLKPSYSSSNLLNSGLFFLPFIEGSIAIFPSWLPHGVGGDNKSNIGRITISCNSMIHCEVSEKTSYLKI